MIQIDELRPLYDRLFQHAAEIVRETDGTKSHHAQLMFVARRDAGRIRVDSATALPAGSEAMASVMRGARADAGPNTVIVHVGEAKCTRLDTGERGDALTFHFYGIGFQYFALCPIDAQRRTEQGAIEDGSMHQGTFPRAARGLA